MPTTSPRLRRLLHTRAFAPLLAALGASICLWAGASLHAVEAAGEAPAAPAMAAPSTLDEITRSLAAYKPKPAYRDDAFVLAAVQEAAEGWREHNGGIGACLVREATGEILARAHNSQYEPFFRSDRHAEMELMDRYEEHLKLNRRNPERGKLRDYEGIALYTSVEPCPMCLARLINAGVKTIYYAAPDEQGGMAAHLDALPPYWKQMAAQMRVEPAHSSPELNAMAKGLFHPMHLPNGAH